MADPIATTGDQLPTWLTVVISVISTIAGWKGLGPVARWAGKRFDLVQQVRVAERAEIVGELRRQLQKALDEMASLRLELGEQIERRIAAEIAKAGLDERVKNLETVRAEDKRECQMAIRALRAEIAELRKAQRGIGP